LSWFLISVIGFVSILPVYFLSLEHNRLEKLFGENHVVLGNFLGAFSGWALFIFWTGIWVSPQPHFNLNPTGLMLSMVLMELSLTHLILGSIFFALAVYFGIRGIMDLGLKTSETHRPDKVVKTGIYSRVRHPQYLGGILGHFSMTLLFSGLYSLYITPLVASQIIVICLKEERELVREFGKEYEVYREEVPMLFPRIFE
jgi:protein-S-isoprenylcysteine O-methyltransferase Ste14